MEDNFKGASLGSLFPVDLQCTTRGAAQFHICSTGKTWPDLRNQKKYWEKIKLLKKKKM